MAETHAKCLVNLAIGASIYLMFLLLLFSWFTSGKNWTIETMREYGHSIWNRPFPSMMGLYVENNRSQHNMWCRNGVLTCFNVTGPWCQAPPRQAMPLHPMPCSITPCSTAPHHVTLRCVKLSYATLYNATLCRTTPSQVASHHTMSRLTIPCCDRPHQATPCQATPRCAKGNRVRLQRVVEV